jgi:hypothetical protein
VSSAEKKLSRKEELQRALQVIVLRSKGIFPFSVFFRFLYAFAEWLFIRFTLASQRSIGVDCVESIYLRRGGGRSELVAGASDLDFFVVLKTISAQQEMLFLKEFWRRYGIWRNWLPFLGETLMGDRNELENWFQTGCVRAYETKFSWKHLWGAETLRAIEAPLAPDLRDIFSECLKCYWALLQPVLKLQDENLGTGLKAASYGAAQLRHGVKAALDLFRLHYASTLAPAEAERIYRVSRQELLRILPKQFGENLGQFENLLALRDPLFTKVAFDVFAELIHSSFLALDEISARLEKEKEPLTGENWEVRYHSRKGAEDPYSLSVRELFAERLLFRHGSILKRAILSENTAHMYFPTEGLPPKEELRAFLLDLRDVSFSLDRFSVPMPLTERCFKQLEKTSLLDTPFHSFYSHKELRCREDGSIEGSSYVSPTPALPLSMLRKTFAELSFMLRLQPQPEQFAYFLEKIFTLALSLRLSYSEGKIVTDFSSALELFSEKYPARSGHLRQEIVAFMHLEDSEEKQLWSELEKLVGAFSKHDISRATFLQLELQRLRNERQLRKNSKTLATDMWINLTPFLRMEMNAVKDRCFPIRPSLRL